MFNNYILILTSATDIGGTYYIFKNLHNAEGIFWIFLFYEGNFLKNIF